MCYLLDNYLVKVIKLITSLDLAQLYIYKHILFSRMFVRSRLVWLAVKLVKSLAAPTHVHLRVQEVWVQFDSGFHPYGVGKMSAVKTRDHKDGLV